MQDLQLQIKILEAKLQKCKAILEQFSITKGADMIVKDKTNQYYEKQKKAFGITGDIYVINDHLVESLESHKLYMQQHNEVSTAETIEQAEQERILLDERLRQEAIARAEELKEE